MAPRVKPPTPTEQLQSILAAVEMVSAVFPDAVVTGMLPYGEIEPRCAGHVVGQTGRIPCGRAVNEKRGSLCEHPKGCRREGRLDADLRDRALDRPAP